MGYTHYYHRPTTLPTDKWATFIQDVRQIVRAGQERGIDIHDGLGEVHTRPQITRTMVRLNGSEVDDQGHETLFIPRVYKRLEWERPLKRGELRFAFCKTARKPYDAVVGAILIAFVRHFWPLVRVDSDGDAQDWEEPSPGQLGPLGLHRLAMPDAEIPTAGDMPWMRVYTPTE